MTASRNTVSAVAALVAAILFMFSGATDKASGELSAQFAQHIARTAEPGAIAGDEQVAQVVVTGRRMTDKEKAAFDRTSK